MEKKDKVPYIIGAILLFVIGAIAAYIYWNTHEVEFPVKKYALTVGIILLIVGVIGFVLYKLISNTGSKNERDISSPKEFVSTKRAIQIFKEELIKDNKIPYLIPHWLDDPVVTPVNEDAVEIRDILNFSDPGFQTSDTFLGFEVIVREGKKTGMMVAVIRIDLGEEWLRDNWNTRIRWNKSMNTYNLDNKRYPLTSSKGYAERLQMKRIELSEEGFSEREINEMINPFLASQQSNAHMIQQTEKRSPIKSADVKDVFPDYPDSEDDDGADVDDLQEDIDKFRMANK